MGILFSQFDQFRWNFSSIELQRTVQKNLHRYWINESDSSSKQKILPQTNPLDLPDHLQSIYFHPNHFQNFVEIGRGHFGTVYRAKMINGMEVAIKTLNINSSRELSSNPRSIFDLIDEANLMIQLNHQHLLKIIGITTFLGEQSQIGLVTKFMINGSLVDFLRTNRENFLQSKNKKEIRSLLNRFVNEIFSAMIYLECHHIVHRDLAARNCLIDEHFSIQLADFGLARITEYGSYRGTSQSIFALRWSSPESLLFYHYSSKSDLWSFGITLWEIYSLGEKPYPSLNNVQVKNLLKNPSSPFLKHFPRMYPEISPKEIFTHLIPSCLIYSSLVRPKFEYLDENLRWIFSQ